jgi:beta-glucosidase
VVDLARDPRWGRTEEVYGEDPYLSAAIGGAFVRGMQGDDPRYLKAVPTLKHFAANSMEDNRTSASSNVDPRNLREYYLKPFEKITREQNVQSYMVAYNAINSLPCAVTNLVRDVARAEWGFQGFVVTDSGDLGSLVTGHRFAPDNATGAALIVKAGMDSITDTLTVASVQAAITQGLLRESDLDTALRRNLRIRFLIGEFDPPGLNPYDNIPDSALLSPDHAALARQAGRESVVLLKNSGNLLPLDATKLKRVAVIGPNADVVHRDWYAGYLTYAITPRQGIAERLGPDAVVFDEGASKITLKSRANARFLTAGANGASALAATSLTARDGETFLAQDLGWGCTTLRSSITGKYVTSVSGNFVANDVEAHNWNYVYCFNFVAQPGGGYDILYYNGRYLTANTTLRTGGTTPDAWGVFDLTVVEDGIQRAAALAAGADAAIVFAGNNPTINGKENQDRPGITLPPAQDQLIQAVLAANPNTALALVASYPLAVNQADQNVPAILYSSHGGQELGHFLADVLFGDYNPGGRLTATWFKSLNDLPPMADFDIRKGRTYWYFQGEPLYPFGYGLSYATFAYSNLTVTPAAAEPGDTVLVTVDVRNTGQRAGDEVAQLYMRAIGSKVQRPIQELKRFERISLQPGESRTVSFALPVSELNYWDVRRSVFSVETGTVELRVGASSRDIRLTGRVQVNGETPAPRNGQSVIRAENYDEYSGALLAQSGDGAQVVGSVSDGSWLAFREVDFGAGIAAMTARAASAEQGGAIEAHLDSLGGALAGTCAMAGSGSWQTWTVATCGNFQASGVHDLYLVFRGSGGVMNLDWFQFGAAGSPGAPSVQPGGAVDAAGFAQPLLRGSWSSVFGSNLASAVQSWVAGDFNGTAMPTALAGTRVLVNGIAASVSYVSATQVNFQTPANVSLGPGTVQVVAPSGTTMPIAAMIDDSRPAFYSFTSNGRNWAKAQHADYTLVGPAGAGTAAKPNEVIVLWGSGFGATMPPFRPGYLPTAPAPLADAAGLTVAVGGQLATVQYVGMTMAGVYQINLTLPNLADGDYAIAATASGRATTSTVYIPIRR